MSDVGESQRLNPFCLDHKARPTTWLVIVVVLLILLLLLLILAEAIVTPSSCGPRGHFPLTWRERRPAHVDLRR